MKQLNLLILPSLLLLVACGGGRNYLAVSGNRCPDKFNIEVFEEDETENIVAFDINQLPVGEYEYTDSVIYYSETTSSNKPTMISITEKATKTKDKKTKELVTNYNESINCARNIKKGQNLAFSYTLTTDFSIAETKSSTKKTTRSGQITTRVASVLMSKNTNGAIKPNFVVESNKEGSDKLSKYIPADTDLQLYRKKSSEYELRTKTQFPNYEIISIIRYRYKAPGQ